MKVLEVIQRSTTFLAEKGVDSPRLQIELLLAHVLQMPRLRLYLDFERELNPAQLDTLRGLVRRRGQREPLQHLVGSACFCGLDLKVTPDVLIPRPETELLAERGWMFLGDLAKRRPPGTPVAALDLGTGSGCLAIALAAHCPSGQVTATDISSAALEIARENAVRHGVADRITVALGDAFGAVPADRRFDLIVSNPPYIPTGEIAHLQPEVRDHDPRPALDGGDDGLRFYRLLAARARSWLTGTAARIMLEFGDGQDAALRDLFTAEMWIVEAVVEDYSRRPRVLILAPD